MILQGLRDLAVREELLENADYEPKGVAWIIALDAKGRFLTLVSTYTRQAGKKKPTPKTMFIPRRRGRTSGSAADFLVDKSEYVLGCLPEEGNTRDLATQERLKERQRLFIKEIVKACEATEQPELAACLTFLGSDADLQHCVTILNRSGYLSNDLFAFEIDGTLAHEIPALAAYFSGLRQSAGPSEEQCLLCGAQKAHVSTHPVFQVRGGTSSGIPLVTVNAAAFESYGWHRNKNGPVCRTCADAYGTGLRRLLRDDYPDPKHAGAILPKRAVGLSSDTTAVFWADTGSVVLDLIANLFNEGNPKAVEALLMSPWKGRPPGSSAVRFYCLVVTGSQGRATIRTMQVGFLPEIELNVQSYFRSIQGISDQPMPLFTLLRSLAVRGKTENVAAALASNLFLAILFGRPFPRQILAAACLRCRAEQSVTRARAMLLSAYFQSRTDRRDVMGLNRDENDAGYRLGRLLAVLERLQGAAQRKLNKTIVDRYYGAASTRPATVFPKLLSLSVHHAAKLEGAGFYQRQIAEVVDGLGRFPTTLTLEEQGMFALGYFHQRQAFFSKAAPPEPESSVVNEREQETK